MSALSINQPHNSTQHDCEALSTQLAMPVDVSVDEVARKREFGQAITLCYDAAGLVPKQVLGKMRADKAQLSRWESGEEGVRWPKLAALMDICGNDVPVLWMAHQRGFDLHSMRRRESELERQLRLVREENAALRRVLARSAS